MRYDMLGKTLMFAVNIGKTYGTSFDPTLVNSIFHKKFRHQFSACVTGALAVFCR